MEIAVTEKEENARHIAYAAARLAPAVRAAGAKSSLTLGGGRIGYTVKAEISLPRIRALAEEAAADCIAIGYKYACISRSLSVAGLSRAGREILIAALIAADLPEERRYAAKRFAGCSVMTLDGVFAFRLGGLGEKWERVIGSVPSFFTEEKLFTFLRYLFRGEGRGKVILCGGEVYDGQFRKLRRATLIGEGDGELSGVREIILSGASEVECVGMPPPLQEAFLRRCFAGRVLFA